MKRMKKYPINLHIESISKYSTKMWWFKREGASGFSGSSTAEQVTQGIDGTNLTAIVTGGSRGIGLETTRVLALRGVRVIMAVRSVDAGNKAKELILKDIPAAKIDIMELDLSSFQSVRKFASAYLALAIPLNIIVNNAGILVSELLLSKDNIELQFATNHLGHFLLTNLLLDVMKTTAAQSHAEGRIVNLSSVGHRIVPKQGIQFDKINQDTWFKYGQTKLANILHSKELARRLKDEGIPITANSVHPGAIATDLLQKASFPHDLVNMIGKYIFKSVEQGAATTCYVALNPQVKGVTGEYFSGCNLDKASSLADDPDLAKKLWDFSLNLTHPK